MTDDEKIIRGQEARRLLNHEILRDAFDALEREAVEAMIACDEKDDLMRFRLVERVKTIRDVRRYLNNERLKGKETAQRHGLAFD